jgi:hypothetical protein
MSIGYTERSTIFVSFAKFIFTLGKAQSRKQ